MLYTFQRQIATGRTTFPVAILISLVLWAVTYQDKTELLSLLACGFTSYLLIELNTTFALIRTRTEMPSALFLWLYSSSLFLHPYQNTCWVQLLVMVMLFSLFYSYESKKAPNHIFHTFFFLGIGSMLIPELLWLVPLCFISMAALRSFHVKSFFASLIGFTVPFWIVLGYQLFVNISHPSSIEGFGLQQLIQQYFGSVFPFGTSLNSIIHEYQSIRLDEGITYGITLIMAIVGSFACNFYSNNDKVRTRSFLNALVPIQLGITLLVFLRPSLMEAILPVQAIFAAITCSYVFSLIFNSFTYYFLIAVLVLSGGISLFNLWIHFFNF